MWTCKTARYYQKNQYLYSHFIYTQSSTREWLLKYEYHVIFLKICIHDLCKILLGHGAGHGCPLKYYCI